VCSRRDADRLIADRKVSVNGEVVTEMGTKVRLKDTVEVNGRRIVPEHLTWLLLNKPKDAITTTSDERGRKTVFDLIDQNNVDVDGLFPVGRLDRNTTGVLLITNDGDLAHRLMHPSYEITKMYVVTVDRPVEALGYEVKSLERVRYAGLTTKGVRRGKGRRLDTDEVSALYRQVKL